jgi:nitrogen fixation/metabolism regulation signal transduction histidine kinase
MDAGKLSGLKRFAGRVMPYLLLFVLMVSALYLLSDATQSEARFGVSYIWLLLFNTLVLVLLLVAIGDRFWHLHTQRRDNAPGARLTTRMILMFLGLILPTVLAVYLFSLHLLHRSIDSWGDVRVETALDDALRLGQLSLNTRLRDLVRRTQEMVDSEGPALRTETGALAAVTLNGLQRDSRVGLLVLLDLSGRVVASTTPPRGQLTSDLPGETVLLQLQQGDEFYAGIEPVGDARLQMRVVMRIPQNDPLATARILQAISPVPTMAARLASTVEAEVDAYRTLAYLRTPLKYSLTITLSIVLLFAVFLAVLAAFVMARRMVAPIRRLADATRAVAAGDYQRQLEIPSGDELGSLVRSFNTMTSEIHRAAEIALLSQQEVEGQRSYLEAVLTRLSSGVLALDDDHVLRTANQAAIDILGAPLAKHIGRPLVTVTRDYPYLSRLTELVQERKRRGQHEWQEQVVLFGASGRQVLSCRGTSLVPGGYVLVFDDVTAIIQAQRDAAWGEMARRLAHEVKNPLTPIQLAAERLRHKFLSRMPAEDAQVLDRATHTIVQQVVALKDLVNAFTDYARTPLMQREPLRVNGLIHEIADLYRGEDQGLVVDLDLTDDDASIAADSGRLRQVLHNLFKNAIEAMAEQPEHRIRVATAFRKRGETRHLEIRVEDQGPGFPLELMDRLFEPYVTTKFKGTGLGLAIVQKIVEEHGGVIRVGNAKTGAWVEIQLPVGEESLSATRKTG